VASQVQHKGAHSCVRAGARAEADARGAGAGAEALDGCSAAGGSTGTRAGYARALNDDDASVNGAAAARARDGDAAGARGGAAVRVATRGRRLAPALAAERAERGRSAARPVTRATR
jgi:hypothetical protein